MVSTKNSWLVFIMSQPGKSTTPRIRLWRLLKGLGAAVLRDGVYLLPHRETLRQALEEQVQGVQTLGEPPMSWQSSPSQPQTCTSGRYLTAVRSMRRS